MNPGGQCRSRSKLWENNKGGFDTRHSTKLASPRRAFLALSRACAAASSMKTMILVLLLVAFAAAKQPLTRDGNDSRYVRAKAVLCLSSTVGQGRGSATRAYHLLPSDAICSLSGERVRTSLTFAEPLVSISKSGHVWLTAPSRISGETGQNERNGALSGEWRADRRGGSAAVSSGFLTFSESACIFG